MKLKIFAVLYMMLGVNSLLWAKQPFNIQYQKSLSELVDSQNQNTTSVPENQYHMDVTLNTTPPPTPVLLTEITNVPVIPKIVTSKRGNKKHAQILSSTPMKYQLEEKQKKQVERKIKKEKVQKIKTTDSKKLKPQVKGKGVRNLKRMLDENENKEEYYCIFCSEKYESPPREDWIMFAICNNWAHDNCTSGQFSKGYVCDFCLTK